MKYLHILTPYGKRYIASLETGEISNDNGTSKPEFSGQWKILGFEKIGPFNSLQFIPLSQVPALINHGGLKNFKNGKPRFTVRDLDHGTTRVWGNWTYHGVHSAWIDNVV